MNLVRVAEARRDQHLGAGGMPVLESGRARFGVAADLFGQFPGNRRNAVDDEIVAGSERRFRRRIGGEAQQAERETRKPTGQFGS